MVGQHQHENLGSGGVHRSQDDIERCRARDLAYAQEHGIDPIMVNSYFDGLTEKNLGGLAAEQAVEAPAEVSDVVDQ